MKYILFFAVLILTAGSSIGQVPQIDYSRTHSSAANKSYKALKENTSAVQTIDYLVMAKKLSFGDDVVPQTRSVKDATLFKSLAPSVVLVMTKDGLGSGSLISSDGFILTNKHVVGDFKQVGIFFKPEKTTQSLTNDSMILGEVVKVDELTDLAIIKVKQVPAGRRPVRFGNDDDIGIGLDVHAIGHPKGEYWTYTKGVISQYRPGFEWKGGENEVTHKANVIQTQTPINPGNSGGPLFLDSGILIGVNSFKNSNAEGLNFAVSVEEVKNFIARKGDRVIKKQVANKPKCEPKVLYDGRTDKNNARLVEYDSTCSGKKNIDFVYPDNVKEPFLARVFRRDASKVDAIIYSYKRDEKWNLSYWDNDFDGTWNTVGLHPNGDLFPASYVSRAEYDKK
jgi:S1-C subfamily serine protease